jgi:YidC/Oxa1 family membrane protein insertase
MWLETFITNSFLYKVFYNALIGFTEIFPDASIGVGVILLTILVKAILIPLTYRSIKNQIQQKKIQPILSEIKAQYPDDQKKQSEEIMRVYREHKTNPFSGCILIIIQIIVIIPLYYVFLNLDVYPELLYKFIQAPDVLNPIFLGINLAEKSIILALLAGVAQFTQLYFSPAMRDTAESKPETNSSSAPSQAQMMQGMQKGMKYTMPIMITVFAYLVPSAVALYWIISNLFTIGQELVIRKRLEKKEAEPVIVE